MKYPEDSELMALMRNPAQREKAFEQVVGKYSSRLYWHIRHMVLSHDDADDILQNTFIKAWTNLENFRGDSKLSTWLYKIAINESITFMQQRKPNVAIDDSDLNLANTLAGDAYFDGDETDLLLQKAIQTLPAKQRMVFNMKYFQEMKYEEMSEILQTSIGALKASYHIAVQKIEDFFKEQD